MEMTVQQQIERLLYVQEWDAASINRITRSSLMEWHIPAESLAYFQSIADAECLSVLRGGDPELDRQVLAAFGGVFPTTISDAESLATSGE